MVSESVKLTEKSTSRNDLLKLTAMITMLIDHIGAVLFPGVMILRTIGRIAFPIFAYQISKGFRHTSDLKKYATRLLIFGLISQIPYMFLDHNLDYRSRILIFNVILLFFIAVCMLYVFRKGILLLREYKENKSLKKLGMGIGLLICSFAIVILPDVLQVLIKGLTISYGSYGLLMILMFYLIGDNIPVTVIGYIVLSFLSAYEHGAIYAYQHQYKIWGAHGNIFRCLFIEYKSVWKLIAQYNNNLENLRGFFFQSRSIIALIPIYAFPMFKTKIKLNKYVGYVFYPLHITIIVLIGFLIK